MENSEGSHCLGTRTLNCDSNLSSMLQYRTRSDGCWGFGSQSIQCVSSLLPSGSGSLLARDFINLCDLLSFCPKWLEKGLFCFHYGLGRDSFGRGMIVVVECVLQVF